MERKNAIQKLSKASGSTKEKAEKMATEIAIVPNIFTTAKIYIPRPNASVSLHAKPNDIHQADILYLPHDKYKKIYKSML